MKAFTSALVAGSLLLSTSAIAADRVKPGNWETKMVASIGAAPMVSTYCITADEATKMNGDVATVKKYLVDSTTEKLKGRCSVKNVIARDNKTTVTITCGKTEVTSTTTYYGDHYESTSSNGTKVSGKRIGVCKK
jgi:hypothetical protein